MKKSIASPDISDTVTEMESVLARLKRQAVPTAAGSQGDALRIAERMCIERRRRVEAFGALAREPAWDILLDLYVSRRRNAVVQCSDAAHAAGIPSTTALRWLQLLGSEGLVERTPDPTDQRRVHISLTEPAFRRIEDYLRTVDI